MTLDVWYICIFFSDKFDMKSIICLPTTGLGSQAVLAIVKPEAAGAAIVASTLPGCWDPLIVSQ